MPDRIPTRPPDRRHQAGCLALGAAALLLLAVAGASLWALIALLWPGG